MSTADDDVIVLDSAFQWLVCHHDFEELCTLALCS